MLCFGLVWWWGTDETRLTEEGGICKEARPVRQGCSRHFPVRSRTFHIPSTLPVEQIDPLGAPSLWMWVLHRW